MRWLIESGVWDEEQQLKDLLGGEYLSTLLVEPSQPHMCYGSLEWIDKLQKLRYPKLLSIANFPNFDCRYYYPHFQPHLFNRDYRFATASRLIEHFHEVTEGIEVNIFVRPATGFKPNGFTGKVINSLTFDSVMAELSELDPAEMMVLSSEKHIDREYRAIVANKQYVTGCQYRSYCPESGKLGVDPDPYIHPKLEQHVNYFAANKWEPDPIYVMDIVESQGKLSIMELNALSTSGWYDTDIVRIINCVQRYWSSHGYQNPVRRSRRKDEGL